MKYKHIPSALHNFAHSFVSLENYYDGEYVVDVLEQMARNAPKYEVRINFSTGVSEPASALDDHRVGGSMKLWRESLPKHLARHNVDPASVRDVLLRFRLTRAGKEVIIEAQDDRGHQYKVFVHGML